VPVCESVDAIDLRRLAEQLEIAELEVRVAQAIAAVSTADVHRGVPVGCRHRRRVVELRGDEPDAPSRIYAMTATGPTGLELSTAAIATMSAAVMTVPRHSSAATAERATTTAAELDLGAGRARGCACRTRVRGS